MGLFDNLFEEEDKPESYDPVVVTDPGAALEHHQEAGGGVTGVPSVSFSFDNLFEGPQSTGEKIKFAFDLGFADTWRGAKQIIGVGEEGMAEDQAMLNSLISDNPKIAGAYFAGLLFDPAGWAYPAMKAKNIWSAMKMGAVTGTAAGATGYVDPEARSLLGLATGEDKPMTRTEQTLIGTLGGTTLAPIIKGVGGATSAGIKYGWGDEGLGIGSKLHAAAKVPEVFTAGVGGVIGSRFDEEGEWQNTIKGVLAGLTLAASTRAVEPVAKRLGIETDPLVRKSGTNVPGSRKWFGQMFIDNYGLPKNYVAYKHGRRMTQAEIAQEFTEVVEDIMKLSPADNKRFYRILEGTDDVDAVLAGLNQRARAVITKNGQRLVDLGVLDADTFAKNLDTYIHRSYRKYASAPGIGADPKKIQVFGDELKMRGEVYDVGRTDMQRYLDEGFEVVEDLGEGNFRVRRDWSKADRIAMGEVEDSAFAMARTGKYLSNDVSAFQFYDDIAKNPAFATADASVARQQGWRMVPTEKITDSYTSPSKYGSLAGKYVSPEVYRDIVGLEKWRRRSNQPLGENLSKLNRWWKITKTALNPAVHMNNILSNVQLFDFQEGSFKLLGPAARALWRGNQSPLYKEAQRAGLFDSDYVARELRDVERDAYGVYARFADSDEIQPDSITNLAKRLAVKSAKWVPDQLINLYQAEDRVFRLALYKTLRDKGMGAAEAAQMGRKQFVDYDIEAPAINMMRNTGWPFIAYTYRVAPLLLEAATTKPWKVAKWGAIWYGYNKAGEALSGKSEEELAQERSLAGEETMYGIRGMPYTNLNTGLSIQDGKLQFGGDGTPQYLQSQRFVPGGDIFDMGSPLGEKFEWLPAPLQPSGGALGSIILGSLGINPMTMEKAPGWDSMNMGERNKIRGKLLLEQFTPNFPGVPGAYSTRKIQQSLSGKYLPLQDEMATTEAFGVKIPWQALANSIGIKLKPVDIQKLAAREEFKLENIKKGYGQLVYQARRERELERITDEELKVRLDDLRRKFEQDRLEAIKKVTGNK